MSNSKSPLKGKKKELSETSPSARKPSMREATLDQKGRINDKMLMQYDGLYNKLKARVVGLPANYQQERDIDNRTDSIQKEYMKRRYPQASSQSTSPYLMMNGFNFDVTEILHEVKASREKRLMAEKYWNMDFSVLREVVKLTEGMAEEEIELMQ